MVRIAQLARSALGAIVAIMLALARRVAQDVKLPASIAMSILTVAHRESALIIFAKVFAPLRVILALILMIPVMVMVVALAFVIGLGEERIIVVAVA